MHEKIEAFVHPKQSYRTVVDDAHMYHSAVPDGSFASGTWLHLHDILHIHSITWEQQNEGMKGFQRCICLKLLEIK